MTLESSNRNEMRSRVESILRGANRSYLLNETSSGFKVYISDQPLIYVFEFEKLSGWIVYIEIREDRIGDPIFVEDAAYTEIERMVDTFNFENFTYSEESTKLFSEDKREIEAFFKTYESLIAHKSDIGNELTYRFKSLKNVVSTITIRFAPGMDYWDISYKNFVHGANVIDALYDVFHGAEDLIYQLNKKRLHE